jgi:1-deoxy-D-xylulose-5-phosphate reductoisomerase
MTGIALLGSTGSIGRQTLEVVEAQRDRFEVRGLAAGHASAAFEEQLAAWPAARA